MDNSIYTITTNFYVYFNFNQQQQFLKSTNKKRLMSNSKPDINQKMSKNKRGRSMENGKE